MKMKFKLGNKAVYPGQGVGIIEDIKTMEFSGNNQSFYVIKIIENGMTIMVPTNNTDSVGLREIISTNEVEKIYEILRDRKAKVDHQTWNRRYRMYMEKIKSGSVYEIAHVLRDLRNLREEKDLSFGEKRMLDTAKNLLIKEISVSNNEPESSTEKELNRVLYAKQ